VTNRHGAPGGLGRGLGALIRTTPRPEDPESIRRPNTASDDLADRIGGAGAVAGAPPADGPADRQDHTRPADTDDRTKLADRGEPATAAPVDLVEITGARFAELPVSSIQANPRQPRQVFDQESLAELTHSVREFGVLQPVVVRGPFDGGRYQLVMGERRLRAATAAGLISIPAIVRETADDVMLRDALLENLHRTSLNPLEEAAAYQQLLAEFGVTHDELAQRIGRSRSQVSNTIRLLNLSVPVQRRVAAGVISAGHARALLSLSDREAQDELAGRIVAEGLSVRATEEIAALADRDAARATRAVRPTATQRITAPALRDLADRLSDTLDTRVRVDLGRRKGRITVEFASIDDLERIVAVIAPQLAVHRTTEGAATGDDQPNEP
jgi:ParB family chromosome partitioning protein